MPFERSLHRLVWERIPRAQALMVLSYGYRVLARQDLIDIVEMGGR